MNTSELLRKVHEGDPRSIGRAISLVEDQQESAADILHGLDQKRIQSSLILGITGPPGAGKSTLTAKLVKLLRHKGRRVGIVAIDPSSPVSGGALLGDRIRMMDHALDQKVVVRSMATRGKLGGLCAAAGAAVRIMAASGCQTIIIETVGIGQSEMDIIRLADITAMVLAPGFGDEIQAMKAGILEVADLIVVNKADHPGAQKLMLDLGTVFTSSEDKNNRLLQTIASEEQGLDLLLAATNRLEEQFRQNRTLEKRRRESFALETMDWALEMLRPHLTDLIQSYHGRRDPRLTAEQVTGQLMHSKSQAILDWEQGELANSLTRFPERKKEFTRQGGRPVPRLALPDAIDKTYEERLGFPGRYPYTRGVQPTMYRGRLWTMRQYAGFSTAAESNERYRYLLDQGQTGLSVAFDLPTQIGYDSDDPMSLGEVGKVGVAIDTLEDMEILFDRIPLDTISTSMTINSPAMVLLAMYVAVAEKQGVGADKLRGTIQNDILKEYVARGTYIFPPRPSLRLITNIFKWCAKKAPLFNTISISGYHIREAGSTAAQEVAFTLANGITYVQEALEAGLELDVFARRLAFFFNASSNLLEEVAKFRAARRLWATIMKERFGAEKPASTMLRFHTQTAGNTLTAQQIDNNIVRVTIQALAAVLGGTQSLHTNSRDEALGLPTEESVRTALRTQQIIAHESGIVDTVDPLAGSYYIEQLTDAIEDEARELIGQIEQAEGVVACIENGFIQGQIADASYRYQQEIERGEQIIVGVNEFKVTEDISVPVLRVDAEVEEQQVRRLAEVKAGRNQGAVNRALRDLEQAAKTDTNLMEPVLKSVRLYCSLGEICGVLRKVFGEYRQ